MKNESSPSFKSPMIYESNNTESNFLKYLKIHLVLLLCVFTSWQSNAQEYPFTLPENVTATYNIQVASGTEPVKNSIMGVNIYDYTTEVQKNFVRTIDPGTIRFPTGVFSNFYNWETDEITRYGDTYNNAEHTRMLDTYERNHMKIGFPGLTVLNNEKKAQNGVGYDVLWTYSVNYDSNTKLINRLRDSKAKGFQVNAIEINNEAFFPTQRSTLTSSISKFVTRAKSLSTAIRNEDPNVKISFPVSWRDYTIQLDYNNAVSAAQSYFDAISVHKYIGLDMDDRDVVATWGGVLTARLTLDETVNYCRTFAAKPVWLSEWAVATGDLCSGAAALGMADSYNYLFENQDKYDRANWFVVNGTGNSFIAFEPGTRNIIYPLLKTGYGCVHEIVRDVFEGGEMYDGIMTTTTLKGNAKAVSARAVKKNGKISLFVVNLTNKAVPFVLKMDGASYTGSYKHEALSFSSIGAVYEEFLGIDENPLTLIKNGSGTILLPPLSVSKISNVAISAPTQSPYGGINRTLPGKIEAEDYDLGGQDVAYYDNTSGNSGGLYRSDDVDIQATTDDGDGYSISHTTDGEWLEYTVNVASGTYNIQARAASISAGRQLIVKLDGVTLGTLNIPNTGNWGTFLPTNTLQNVAISGGSNKILRLEIVGGGFNLNNVDFAAVVTAPAISFVAPTYNQQFDAPANVYVKVDASSASGISNVKLYLDGVLIRQENIAPYEFGMAGQNDVLLENMASGNYSLRADVTENNGTVSNKFTAFTVAAPNQTPYSGVIQFPGTIQAENYDIGGQHISYFDSLIGNTGGVYRSDDVDVQAITGGGYQVAWIETGEWLEYTVNVPTARTYNFTFHYSTPNATSSLGASLPDAGTTLFTDCTFAATGSWANYATRTRFGVAMPAGQHVLRLNIEAGGLNIDKIDITEPLKSGSLTELGPDNVDKNELRVYPNPSSDGFFHLSYETQWEVSQLDGKKVSKGEGSQVDLSAFAKGIYLLKTPNKVLKLLNK